jgi:hypothetical protein
MTVFEFSPMNQISFFVQELLPQRSEKRTRVEVDVTVLAGLAAPNGEN